MTAVETEQRTYSAKEAAELIGCTYRQLDYWARTGLLAPSVASANGSGTRRRFSHHDVLAGRAALILVETTTTATARRCRAALPALRNVLASDAPPAGIYVTADGALSTEPVTGAYIALADLDQPMSSGDSAASSQPRAGVTGPKPRICRGCGDPSPWPYCSPECAPGGAW